MNNFKKIYEANASLSKVYSTIHDGMKYRLIPTNKKKVSYKPKLKTDLW
jgi:hypothetical protein